MVRGPRESPSLCSSSGTWNYPRLRGTDPTTTGMPGIGHGPPPACADHTRSRGPEGSSACTALAKAESPPLAQVGADLRTRRLGAAQARDYQRSWATSGADAPIDRQAWGRSPERGTFTPCHSLPTARSAAGTSWSPSSENCTRTTSAGGTNGRTSASITSLKLSRRGWRTRGLVSKLREGASGRRGLDLPGQGTSGRQRL